MCDKELTDLYEEYKNKWQRDLQKGIITKQLAERLSCPLLLSVKGNEWTESNKKILFVGQETNDWSCKDASGRQVKTFNDFLSANDSVVAMKTLYNDFDFGSHYKSTPFWQAFNEVKAAGSSHTVLWTNLFRFCFNQGSVRQSTQQEYEQISALNAGILAEEIKILKPMAVIFVTGPNYDAELRHSLPGADFSEFDSQYPVRTVARVKQAVLPITSFRIYHPNYLRRSRKWMILQRVLEAVGEANNGLVRNVK